MLGPLLAVLAMASYPPASYCAHLEIEPEWGPNDRLMPDGEFFSATVRSEYYWQPPPPTVTCGAAPSCFEVAAPVRFDVVEAPDYATVEFEPDSSMPKLNLDERRYEATSTATVSTTRDAPAFHDGDYSLRGSGCGWPYGLGAIQIKNDYLPMTNAVAGEPYVVDEPAATVPTVSIATMAGAVGLVAVVVRRRS